MRELLGWLNRAQDRAGGDVYAEWGAPEAWALLEAWAADDEPDGVMVERQLGEIFLLG